MPAKKSEKAEKTEIKAKTETKSDGIKAGNKIKIEYTGTLDDGTVFDSSSKHNAPLEFEVGGKQVIKGFDNAVVGMKKGEEKTFRLEPADAYGDPNPQLHKQIPRTSLPQDKEPKAGMILVIGLPNGMQVPAKIAAVDAESITLDLNHPLAGKALTFKIKVLEIA